MDLVSRLTDTELVAEVKGLVRCERGHGQLDQPPRRVDARRLYLGAGCSSLYTYCTQVLRLSEHGAYGRIEAARAGRRFPRVLRHFPQAPVPCSIAGLRQATAGNTQLRCRAHNAYEAERFYGPGKLGGGQLVPERVGITARPLFRGAGIMPSGP